MNLAQAKKKQKEAKKKLDEKVNTAASLKAEGGK